NQQFRIVGPRRSRRRRRCTIVPTLSCSSGRLLRGGATSTTTTTTTTASAASSSTGSCHDGNVLLAFQHKGHWRANAGTERQRQIEKLLPLVRGERFHSAVVQCLNHEIRSQGQSSATRLSATK